MMLRSLLSVLLACSVLANSGCEKRDASAATAPPPFKKQEYEYVMAVVIDMSPSFQQHLQSDEARAFQFFMRLSQKYFQQRSGSNDRILLTQLSGGRKTCLWDGRPGDIRKKFPTAQAFAQFLKRHASQGGSHVFAAVDDTLSYLSRRPGITPRTTLLTVILSDLIDNDPNADESKQRLIDSLTAYQQRGGHIGCYWVADEMTATWSDILERSGYDNHVWSEIIDDPDLPEFDY